MATVLAAELLMVERQQKQAMLVLKYLYEEWKQFRYLVLDDSIVPAFDIPMNPQSTDILKIQQDIDLAYTNEINRLEQSSLEWVFIEVNATAEPTTIKSLQMNGSTTVSLPIPMKRVTDPTTNASSMVADTLYYQMRIHDVGVYLLDDQGKPIGDKSEVQVFLTKSGESSFFDANMLLHKFAHEPVKYGNGMFVYSPATGCPLTSASCGDLCEQFIRYSPYGLWQIQVYSASQQGIDMSKLASIRFEFSVDTGVKPGYSPKIFGRDPEMYPQGNTRLCATKSASEVNGSNATASVGSLRGGSLVKRGNILLRESLM